MISLRTLGTTVMRPASAIVLAILVVFLSFCGSAPAAQSETCHVWEKVEIVLRAKHTYANPHKDVDVWVNLAGPDFTKRCYGFWDGDDVFRVRVMATKPGRWTWSSGSSTSDPGLDGVKGSFSAVQWSRADKARNPCRRGMIRATANGHAFEFADGTPFFLLGDTWWSTGTFRYRWHDDDKPREIGPNVGFKDYVRLRKEQGFNCIAMIAAFGNWANDGKPATIKLADGTVLRSAWRQAGTESAKDMHDEHGSRAFLFPGRIPGYENIFPDVERVNPAYFQNLDRKIDYLNDQGFVPFIEVARRDIGQAWKRFYPWPDSYVRYVRYVWSRYQANICLFSPIHFDWSGNTISAADWNEAANRVITEYGPPPFGTLVGCNSNPSSLLNFGHVDRAGWLTFHQIGNGQRTHNSYQYLTEIFNASPPVPAINGEPYYTGMQRHPRPNESFTAGQRGAPGGTDLSAQYCRSAMYGSVLSGGLGGHIYGAGDWDGGMWGANVEAAAQTRMWEVAQWKSADQVRHLATFVLSAGPRYQRLVPARQLLAPNESAGPKEFVGWAYCARTEDKRLFLLYFERDCPRADLSGALPESRYRLSWFDPRAGRRRGVDLATSDAKGRIRLPVFPDGSSVSTADWALKLTVIEHTR